MAEANPIPTAHCRACGYLLRGLASTGACPECGRSFDLADPKTWTRHPRARRIWRSLRWPLAIVMLLVLAGGSGVGWLYWGWRREQPAIQWVKAQRDPRIITLIGVRQLGPPWLKERAGRWGWLLERAHDVRVELDDSQEARELPRRLRWLETVRVGGPGVTEAWMADLGQSNELKELDVGGLNDSGLRRLGPKKKLEKLVLSSWISLKYEPQVTDAGLAALAGFPELRELHLDSADIKGPGLQYLSHVPKLKVLYLDSTSAGDDAMATVGGCEELERLWLGGTSITSKGVGELARLRKLKSLDLSRTRLDDSVVETLATLRNLEWIGLRNVDAKLSQDAIDRLSQALPAAEIQYWVKRYP